jgi:hypothetical protein
LYNVNGEVDAAGLKARAFARSTRVPQWSTAAREPAHSTDFFNMRLINSTFL